MIDMEMEYQQKMRRCHEYVEALEEEKRKIQVFQRELPLCLELVTQAIEASRRDLSGSTAGEHTAAQQKECSEQTTSGGPVFEEFIQLRRTDSCDDGHDQEESTEHRTSDSKKKSDWLRSVQLWNNHESPDPVDDEYSTRNGCATEVKRNGGALQLFRKDIIGEKNNQSAAPVKATTSVPLSATSSTPADTESHKESKGGEKKEDKEGQMPRKQRRCWSPELHRRFLHALQQLGGSHAATPKQITELMKVDGLTNDEVKSHLQKYRLHTSRPSMAFHNNGNPQAPQFVVVGGIWVPPPAEYMAMTATTGSGEAVSPATLYAPVATVAQPCRLMVQRPKPTWSNDRGSDSGMSHSAEGAARSSSPTGSSSTRTTRASPLL